MFKDQIRTHGLLAFAVGVCITVWTCFIVVEAQDAQIRGNFTRDTEKVATDTSARLRTYFDMLLSLKGMFAVTGEVDRQQFERFVQQLRLAERYPGFRAIQFVRAVPGADFEAFSADLRSEAGAFVVHPQLQRDEHFIIEFNEPMKGNENAFGLDLASIPAHLQSILSARDSGMIVATGRTMLVQDATRNPGFVARAPIYRQNMPIDTLEQRRAAFIGVVAIVFRVDDLMREVIEPSLLEHIAVRIVDTGDSATALPATPDNTLFDSGAPGVLTLTKRVAQGYIGVAQRHWLVQYSALAGSRYSRHLTPPLLVGAAGIWISALIAALLVASRRSRTLAGRLRATLVEQRASLAELEQQKAHVELAHGDLSSVLETLKQAQASLITSEKLASLGALVAGIAHELNTPIGNSLLTATALSDMVNEFEKKYADGGIKRSALEAHMADTRLACGIMASSLSRAADLITSFKQVSVDQTSDKRRPFELGEVVRDTLATFAAQLRRANCRIEVDVAPKLVLDSYPGGIGQVLSNLINNALLHAFQGEASPKIVISAREIEQGQVMLNFSDDGVGMTQKTLHQVFDPFFTTKMGQGGSGLGMNIVYNVVTGMLGGSIGIASTPGNGTSVTIMMPKHAPDQPLADVAGRLGRPELV
ncbi:CHASE domain-containing sensor histidine kinase [Massilia sp. TWR1-2-2]|uniref:CHASE domain-containing sensor histidine kinase n=1 Tax=Massilia sp. TWR1-2-2 TaxID=2804584 RepID=UPI003CE73705